MPQTVLEEKGLYEHRNYDNVFNRAVIAGMLKVLNRKLKYEQIWNEETGDVEEVTIPFFYNFGGSDPNSEKFIQDNYTFFSSDECTDIGLKKIDGNFDMFPRGVIELTSSSIDSGNITNRFALGNYQKRSHNGEVESYVSFLYSIPLTYTFKVSIKSETLETEFKVEQAMREYFYKNKTFYIYYKGMRIGCRAGFPEAYNGDKANSTYTMGNDAERYLTCSFDISVETYQPVFDPSFEIKASHYIKSFNKTITGIGDNSTASIEFSEDLSGQSLPSGLDIMLTWHWNSDGADIEKVKLTWIEIDKKSGERVAHPIGTIDNVGYYDWVIPQGLSDFTKIDCMLFNGDNAEVYKKPSIVVIPDASTCIVSKDNVSILNKGYFLTSDTTTTIDGAFSYLDRDGHLVEHPFKANIFNNMLDMDNPLSFEPFLYQNDFTPKEISLAIESVGLGEGNEVSHRVDSIFVI